MGPSKPSLSGAPFASTAPLYRNEGKTLQTQVLFDFCSNAELLLICDHYKKDNRDTLPETGVTQIFILAFVALSYMIMILFFCIEQKLCL